MKWEYWTARHLNQPTLNSLGKKGWELVAVRDVGYFKRPKEDNGKEEIQEAQEAEQATEDEEDQDKQENEAGIKAGRLYAEAYPELAHYVLGDGSSLS